MHGVTWLSDGITWLSEGSGVIVDGATWQYVHGATSLLAIQIDAAINPG